MGNPMGPARWILELRPRLCYLFSLLRIHGSDCEHCGARGICGDEMRKRLEELNWRTIPRSLNNEVHGDLVGISNSTPEVVADCPVDSFDQPEKIA